MKQKTLKNILLKRKLHNKGKKKVLKERRRNFEIKLRMFIKIILMRVNFLSTQYANSSCVSLINICFQKIYLLRVFHLKGSLNKKFP